MGVFFFKSFPKLTHAATRLVGHWPIQKGTLTRIGPAPPDHAEHAGELIFLDEVPATMKVSEKIVPYRRQTEDGVEGAVAKWWRVEVQVPDRERRVKPRMDLVVARPPAALWTTHAPFKNSDNKAKSRRRNPLDPPAKDAEELITRLESLSYDFWETGDYRTAGISIPVDSRADERRNYSRGGFRLGLCADVKKCRDELWATAKVRQLMKLTKVGTIQFWPTDKEIPDRYKTLHETAQEDAWLLMEVSIWQSFAGPDAGDANLLGQPVTSLVDRLYKRHLFNRNRALIKKDTAFHKLLERCRGRYASQQRSFGRPKRRSSESD